MTECERIIEQGILPASFFEEEILCDTFVDKKKKRIWAVQIDMLLKFDRVCKEHNLRYFLIGGTLIGAVRHKGFIPWDDDIDVALPRKDYEILCRNGSDWFDDPYFFQTPTNDDGYYFSFAKLRNSRAMTLNCPYTYQGYNHGMSIDVFPLDKCVLDDCEKNFTKIKNLLLENTSYMRKSNPTPSDADIERMSEYSTDNPMKNCKKINKIASQYENIDAEYVGLSVCTIYHWEKLTWYAEDFKEAIAGDFHGFSFPIPKGYDRILKMGFGNYMEFPPIESRQTWHSSVIMEPDISYKDYKRNILGIDVE